MNKKRYKEQINELDFDSDLKVNSMIYKVKGVTPKNKFRFMRPLSIAVGGVFVLSLSVFLLANNPSELPIVPPGASNALSNTTSIESQTKYASTNQTQSKTENPKPPTNSSDNTISQPIASSSQSTTPVQNSSAIDSIEGLYTFNSISSAPNSAAISVPPKDSFKKEISFAEYKDILGFNPLPQYIPPNLSVSYGNKNTDKKIITFLSNNTLATKDLGSWSCQFDDSRSYVTLKIEISRGGRIKDYVVNGELKPSKILEEAILCKVSNGSDILLTADFKFRGYNIFISSRNIEQDDFIEMLQSYNK